MILCKSMKLALLLTGIVLLWIFSGIMAFTLFTRRGANWRNWRLIDTGLLTIFIIFGFLGLSVVVPLRAGHHRSPKN